MRSYLFTPGDNEQKLEAALGSGTDTLIIDMDDPAAARDAQGTRETSATFIRHHATKTLRPRLYVRVHALDSGMIDDDLAAIVPARPDGILLPQSLSGQSVTALDVRLQAQEALASLPQGSIKIMAATTDTATSIFHLGSYGDASPRLVAMTWGTAPLANQLGAEDSIEGHGALTSPYRLARDLCLMGARSARVDPVDGIYADIDNLDGLRLEALAARRDGFSGKLAIHPDQIPIINDVFSVDEQTIKMPDTSFKH